MDAQRSQVRALIPVLLAIAGMITIVTYCVGVAVVTLAKGSSVHGSDATFVASAQSGDLSHAGASNTWTHEVMQGRWQYQGSPSQWEFIDSSPESVRMTISGYGVAEFYVGEAEGDTLVLTKANSSWQKFSNRRPERNRIISATQGSLLLEVTFSDGRVVPFRLDRVQQ